MTLATRSRRAPFRRYRPQRTGVPRTFTVGGLTRVDRGSHQQGPSGGTINMQIVTSDWAPTAGSFLVAVVEVNAKNDSGSTGDIASVLTDNFGDSGGTAWASSALSTRGSIGGGQYMERVQAFTRTVGTGPASGHLTWNGTNPGSGTTTSDGWFTVHVWEFTGQNSTPVGLVAQPARATGSTTYSANFSGTPAASSYVVGGVHSDNQVGPAIGAPSGFTEVDELAPAWGAISEWAEMAASAPQNNQWTGLDAASNVMGVLVEVVAGSGSSNATVTPAVLVGTGSFPSPTIVITSVAPPAVIGGVGSQGTPTEVLTSVAAPANVAGTGAGQTPGGTTTSSTGASVITAPGTQPDPGKVATVATLPAVLGGVGSQGSPTEVLTSKAAPAVIGGVGSVWQPILKTGRYPVSVHASGRYLLDQLGDPYMVHGDTGWEMTTNLSLADAKIYLDNRADKLVNAVILEAPILDPDAVGGIDVNGNLPFTGTAFQSSLNEPYWSHVDDIVKHAAARGITIFWWMAYLGYNHGTEGWWAEIAAASNAQVQAYGAALGARYKDYPNIVWVVGGDYIPTATEIDRYDHIMQGIQGAGDSHLASAHLQRRHDGAESFDSFTWFTLNSTYSVDPNFIADTVTAYNRSTVRPTFLVEGRYENFNPPGPTLAQLRREQWQQVLAGGLGGHFYGNENVWSFNSDNPAATDDTDWTAYLDDPGLDHSQLIGQLMDSHLVGLWQELAPDLTDTFLTAGESSGTTQAAASFSTHVGVVYVATTGSITVDLTEISDHATVLVRWYDPTDGGMANVGSFSTSAPQTFTHPGTNTDGDNDWVLVVFGEEGDVTVTPGNVAGVGTQPSPAALAAVRPTPANVAGAGSQPAPTESTTAAVAPANVAGTGAGFTPSGTTTSAAAAGTVTGTGSQAASAVAAATTAPAVIGGAGSQPAPAETVTSKAAPANVAGSGSQFTPTGTTTSAAAAGTASGSATLGGSPVTAAATAPAVIGGVGSQGTPAETVTSAAAPAVVGGVGSLFFGGLSIRFIPGFVAGVGTQPTPDVSTSDTNTAAPAVLIGVGTQPTPTLIVTSVATATVLVGAGSQPTPGGSTAVQSSPGVVVGGAVFTTPGGVTTATVLSGFIPGVGSQGAPATLVAVGPAPSGLTGVGSQPSPSLSSSVQATPSHVAGSGAAVTPILFVSSLAAPPVIPGVAVFPVPDIIVPTDLVVLAAVITAIGSQPTPVILARSSRAYVWNGSQWISCPVKRWDGAAWVADLRPKAWDPVTAQWFPLNQV